MPVFISHSSKDKATADTICNHLESAGIKCWIAPRDIEAGSDWTKGIMRGIANSRALVLVFTAHANDSEHVGREVAKAFSMGLAVIPFRLEAIKPGESLGYFLETVQWLDATSTPWQKHLNSLTERVKNLLANDERSATGLADFTPETKAQSTQSSSSRRRIWIAGVGLVSAAMVITALAWFFSSQNRNTPKTAVTLSAVPVPEKSIAVLPFESLSETKSDTHFADGVQGEILNNLAKIAQLKVISRTSVMQYRADVKRDLRQIANALGVANVLEGTVRREGNHVRVTTELIDAQSDNTIWADSYSRDLTDIFFIQSEVAQTIAKKLAAKLSPEERKNIVARPTDSLEAYDLYLRAKELVTSAKMDYFGSSSAKTLRDAIKLLDQAVQLDPNFALAYCEAAYAHDTLYRDYDPTIERRALGDAAIDKAIRLQPDLPEAHLALAKHLYNANRDYKRARVQLAIARRDLPNDSEAILLEAVMDLRQGIWEKSIRECEEAVKLDPRNLICVMDLASTLELTRQYEACMRAYDRAIDLAPNYPSLKIQKAAIISEHTGEFTEFRAAIAALPVSMANNRDVVIYRAGIAWYDRNWEQVEELIQQLNGGEDNGAFAYANAPVPVACYSILLARLKGQLTNANLVFAAARDELQQKVRVSEGELKACLCSQLAVVDALLGKKEDAVAEAKHAVEMIPVSSDAIEGPAIALNLAVVHAWVEEPDFAFEILVPSAKIPAGIRYGSLKSDPLWDPLRKDPRFEKLLAELAPKD